MTPTVAFIGIAVAYAVGWLVGYGRGGRRYKYARADLSAVQRKR